MDAKGDMEKTVVKMMSTFQVEVEVDIPGTVIRCHLRTVHLVLSGAYKGKERSTPV